jgi:hypothetical protein
MIVIATHNGEQYLINLLSDIKSFGIENKDISIVDNKSDNISHLNYLSTLTNDGYNVLYNDIGTYEVGAFKKGIDTFKSDVWFCIQDSIRLKQNIFELVEKKLTDKNVYTFLTFEKYVHDSPYYKDIYIRNYGTSEYSKGIFGCNIFAKNEVIQLVKDEWILPINKAESEAMERELSIIFDKHNIEIIGIDLLDTSGRIFQGVDVYPFFQKIFARRR